MSGMPVTLSTYELKMLQELCDIFNPFKEATDRVHGGRKGCDCRWGCRVSEVSRQAPNELWGVYNCKMVATQQASVQTHFSK